VRGPQTGRLVLGILLVLLGAGWFADAVGLVEVRWTMILPAALLVIGVALLATAARGGSGGLIGAGVVITVLVLVTSFVSIPLGGRLSGVGDVVHRPTGVEDFESGYGLAVGSLEIDLRETALPPGPVTLEAGVAVGQLLVRLPEGATVEVSARAGMGEVVVDGRSNSGVGVTERRLVDGGEPEAVLVLELSAGMGRVEVRR
jgi:hypothetical protein